MSERSIRSRIPRLRLPDYVERLLSTFEENGYEAYVVGGAVRDVLRGADHINDYDVTTNALPEETKKLFSGYMIYETGIKHGTVTVNVDGNMVEVTTFRTDGEYTDSRHPDKVTFTKNIEEDLARRDFTVNAMALALDGRLVDPFDGVYDIASGVIRAVGDPEKRFSEDALRIMRAYRFSAKLCYEIDEDTLLASQKCSKGLENISRERIGVEWNKLLTSTFCSKALLRMKKYGIFDVIFPKVAVEPDFLAKIETLPEEFCVRCAAFLKNVRIEELSTAADRICLKNSELAAIKAILEALSQIRDGAVEDTRLFAYEYGDRAYFAALIASREGSADLDFAREVNDALHGGLVIKSRSDVCAVGEDLINAGAYDRSLLSPIFSLIITKIVCGTLKNEKTAILNELPLILEEIDADRRCDPVSWRKMSKYRIK